LQDVPGRWCSRCCGQDSKHATGTHQADVNSSLQNNSIWLWLLPLLLLLAGCSWQVVQQELWPGQQQRRWIASSCCSKCRQLLAVARQQQHTQAWAKQHARSSGGPDLISLVEAGVLYIVCTGCNWWQ
jgi:hypothetical protein